jgi:hypothetical protein
LVYSVENEQGKDNDLLEAAQLIVKELEKAGLHVAWNGEVSASLEVLIRDI